MAAGPPGASRDPTDLAHPGVDEVVGYRVGDLPVARMLALDLHLKACGVCRERLSTADVMLAEVDLIVERPPRAESTDIDLLLARLARQHELHWQRRLGRRSPRQPSKRFWLPLLGVALVAAAVAMVQLWTLTLRVPALARGVSRLFTPPSGERPPPR